MNRIVLLVFGLLFILLAGPVRAERVESLATIRGARPLRVSGIGIVVGLNETGDTALAARKALRKIQTDQSINVALEDIQGENIAVVSVTARIPAFARPGTFVDAQVASIYDATSLENGRLQITHLRVRPGGDTVAVASGRILVGGSNENSKFLTTGNIPASYGGGAEVVRSEAVDFLSERNTFELILREPSFANAQAIANAINSNSATNPDLEAFLEERGFAALDLSVPGYAQALDAGTVIVQIPPRYEQDKVKYISSVMTDVNVDVDVPPRVVINGATNTVVITGEVRIARGALAAHGGLSVMVERPPNAPEGANMRFLQEDPDQRSLVEISEGEQGQTENLRALYNTLNAMEARPADIITIIENLHRAGALHAELVNQ
jgi:flagellar P-ring protein precursor FlgI